MYPLVIAVQLTPGESLAVLVFFALMVVGAVRRSRRRSRMTPTELASDDLREEMVRLRREMRRHE